MRSLLHLLATLVVLPYLALAGAFVLLGRIVAAGSLPSIILALIVIISSNRNIMGRWANKRSTTYLGWLVTGIMAASGIAGLIALF